MRKPTWIPGIKWLWKTSDRIDIWFHDKFKINPKQKALELKMDTLPNKRVNKAISDALNIIEAQTGITKSESKNENKDTPNQRKWRGDPQ